MSFVDLAISQRHFRARYVNVGRAVLGQLAAIACVDIETATAWADEIDRETEIVGGGSPSRLVGAPLSGESGGGEAEPSRSPGASIIATAGIAASQQGD